jgi:5-amino-6-(5-phosphoribosylamino)uracil reductase
MVAQRSRRARHPARDGRAWCDGGVLRLWPPTDPPPAPIEGDRLAEAYGYPDGLDRPFVRVNFVASADGAVTADGLSGGLGSAADKRVFGLLRRLSEVIVVGAGTARAEDYGGARRPSLVTGSPPPIAVVTSSGRLDPGARLFTDTEVPPIVVTGTGCPPEQRDRLTAAGADLVLVEDDRVTPGALLSALADRGLHRVLCEGGPSLFGDLIAVDAVDELCLTVSPALAGGGASRAAHGPGGPLRSMRLVHALAEDDVLLLRYARSR